MDRLNEKNPNAPTDALPPAVIHVDCDGARHIYAVHKWDHPWSDDPLFSSGFRNALDFFDRHAIKATFFVIADELDHPRSKELFAEAARRGHTFGSHTTTHRLLTTLSAAERKSEIAGSKKRIEDALGVAVKGFRAPAFDLDQDVLDLVREAGYAYDSSLFPDARSAAKAGEPAIAAAPAFLARSGIFELPLPAHRPLPWPFHPCYSLILGEWYFRYGLSRHARARVPTITLFHLTDFADPMPSERLPSLSARLFTVSHLSAAEKLCRLDRMSAALSRRREITTTDALLQGPFGPFAARAAETKKP